MTKSKIAFQALSTSMQAPKLSPPPVIDKPVDSQQLTTAQKMESWNSRMMANVQKMHEDESFRQQVAKRLS